MFGKKEIIKKKMYGKYLLSKKNKYPINIDKNTQKVIVALAADYGNLGDVAITYAQTNFLKNHFPDFEIIDFPISKTFSHMKSLKSIVNPDDIITIVGGGNTGDMYDDIEFCRQFIIKQFPGNKIVCFPQTIDFSPTPSGYKALRTAAKIYSKHKNLVLSARELTSLEQYKKYFSSNKLTFAPDIVLSLDESNPPEKREGITIVLRSDQEKRINDVDSQKLINNLSEKYLIRFNDTHINNSRMTVEEREYELERIWKVFKSSELVITDRLHGMIFCAITNTPCVAFDNSNKKVSGVHNAWLKNHENIKVLERFELTEVMDTIGNLLKDKNYKENNSTILDDFNGLINLLKE